DLWLGTNNGLSYVHESSPFRFFQVDGDLKGPGHAFAWYKGDGYFGTSNGLYRASSNAEQPGFQAISGAEGQVWKLHAYGDELFICHHNGVLIYDGAGVGRIKGLEGAWIVLPVEGYEDVLMVGHYEGISLIQKKDGVWQLMDTPSPVRESCRIGSIDNEGDYWFSHPYRGTWRIELDTENWTLSIVDFYNEEDDFPSSYHINVSNINGQMIFTAEKGLFTFDSKSSKITPLDSVFMQHDLNRRFLKVFDGEGDDFYLLNQGSLEYFAVQDKALSKEWNVFVIDGIQDRFNAGFEFMIPYDEQNYLLGCDEGFALVRTSILPSYAEEQPQLNLEMNSEANDGEEFFLMSSNQSVPPLERVHPKFNRVKFNYSSNSFHMLERLNLATKLVGFEDEWVQDEGVMTREFSSLEPGYYEFHLKAMNSSGDVISTLVMPFEFKPHWYSSNWAKWVWIFIGLIAIALLVLLPQNRFAKERQQIKVESAKEIDLQKHEAEVMMDQLRNDQLNAELQYKNKELASVTMHLVQKGEILQKIMKTLKVIDVDNADRAKKEVRKLVKLISSDVRLDNHWEQFERCFDSVHVNFLQRLRESYPMLTPNDHKLCAYLRMNLTTKEVATIMNISVRGVEISRYRLRKKFNLDTDTNLSSFIQDI
ncbi:MAG: triple tyrosine motif-containing protein, partial [Bacteroidota bacterium]